MGVAPVGNLALVLAMAAAMASAALSFPGSGGDSAAPAGWGRRCLGLAFGLLTVALGALAWAFVAQDYSLAYVADHASRATTWPYRLAGVWGGMAGSLLLWTWMLSAWSVLATRSLARRRPWLAGGAQTVLAAEVAVFVATMVALASPFTVLDLPAIDGGGLTPVLRHPAMLYHPPLLYAGYVGLAVPAAMAVAALGRRAAGGGGGRAAAGDGWVAAGGFGGQAASGDGWVAGARRWMVAALVLLGAGMATGAHWAYVELGWGGYWAWDPVENGALLPWLAGVAFLHLAMVGERRPSPAGASGDPGGSQLGAAGMGAAGMGAAGAGVAGMRVAVGGVAGMALLAFALSVLGALLTRSGATASVHAFAEAKAVGRVLLALLVATSALAAVVLARQRAHAPPRPTGGAPLATVPGAVRVNTFLLLALVVVIGFGVVWPVTGGRGSVVTGRYFTVVTAPLAIALVAAMGVGPRLGWSRLPPRALARRLTPALWGVPAAAVAVVLLDTRHPVVVGLAMVAGAAVALTVAEVRPGVTIRRLGGLVGHVGVAVLLAGVAGTATGTHRTARLEVGQSVEVTGYRLRVVEVAPVAVPDGAWAAQARVEVARSGGPVATLAPVALVGRGGERVSEAALRSTPREDVQVALRSVAAGGSTVVLEVFVVPLAQWVWWGAALIVAGMAATLAPHRREPGVTATAGVAASGAMARIPGSGA